MVRAKVRKASGTRKFIAFIPKLSYLLFFNFEIQMKHLKQLIENINGSSLSHFQLVS